MSALVFAAALALGEPAGWPGIDEAVVEKIAAEAGRAPRRPLLDTDRGDLLLFVFLGGGAAAGFVLGYGYRALFVDGAAGDA